MNYVNNGEHGNNDIGDNNKNNSNSHVLTNDKACNQNCNISSN